MPGTGGTQHSPVSEHVRVVSTPAVNTLLKFLIRLIDLKYFILIDADNFIKKHFITKEKTDSAHPPPHPGPHCLKSSQDVPWLGWGGRWVQQTRYFETDV